MNDVDRWLGSGADTGEGLELLGKYSPNPWLALLVTRAPRYAWLLKEAMGRFATAGTGSPSAVHGNAFRLKWPFLEKPDCPPELKILAADMITSWHAFSEAHEELYSCSTAEECFETAKKVLKNFSGNRKIYSEFMYYKEHGHVLGRHPIFAETRRLESLRRASLPELVGKKSNLEKNIYRISSRIRSGDRPDLEAAREERLSSYRRELEDVKRIIADYGSKGAEEGR